MTPLKTIRHAQGFTQQRLADELNVDVTQVSRWERGLNDMPVSRLKAIAKVLGVNASDLIAAPDELLLARDLIVSDGRTPLPTPIAAVRSNARVQKFEGASIERMREDLPIYGTALGASRDIDGEAVEQTTLNRGEIIQYAKRPVILNGRTDAYGLYVVGHSMEPVHLEGDLIVAETKRPPRVGDDVVVYLRPAGEDDDGDRARAVMVKRLVRRSASFVEMEQFNPPRHFPIPVADIVRIDRVLRLADLIS